VGGAYASASYTGIERHTKDFDVFVRPQDAERALHALADAGCRVEITFPHWLGKAFHGDAFVDVIWSSGNGVARVDDVWIERAHEDDVLGCRVRVCPPEEMLWSKAFVQERERFDGADVHHLLRARAEHLDWRHLLDRFGANWRVLYGHLAVFGFVYPTERAKIPAWVMRELARRLDGELDARAPGPPLCNGTILSREQYLPDIERWGYADGRLSQGSMSPDDVTTWTAAIGTIA
jgi:hypothetical protein